jgi:two-component sensor histidine kinase
MAGGFSHERALLSALSASQSDLVHGVLRSSDLAKVSIAEARHSLATILTDLVALLRLRCGPHCQSKALQEALSSLSAAAAAQRLTVEKSTDLAALAQRFAAEVAPLLLAGRPVEFVTEVQPIVLSPHVAACLAMVINELLLNAAQHAFPQGRGGKILVRSAMTPDALLLEVADDGVGAQPKHSCVRGESPSSPRGLGLRIVKQIVQRQLGGKFSIRLSDAGRGTIAQVRIPCCTEHRGRRLFCHLSGGVT